MIWGLCWYFLTELKIESLAKKLEYFTPFSPLENFALFIIFALMIAIPVGLLVINVRHYYKSKNNDIIGS